MAAETVDAAVEAGGLEAGGSMTDGLLLEGAHNWTPTMFIRLVQDLGVDTQVAQHLSATYGDRAFSVGKMAQLTGMRWPVVGRRLHSEFPYIDAEIRYAVKVCLTQLDTVCFGLDKLSFQEYAATAVDVISRRLRLSFLNVQAAEEALPIVVQIMGDELGWDKAERMKQTEDATVFLRSQMGKDVNKASQDNIPVSLTKSEIAEYVKRFNALDDGKKGYISINDIRKSLKVTSLFDPYFRDTRNPFPNY